MNVSTEHDMLSLGCNIERDPELVSLAQLMLDYRYNITHLPKSCIEIVDVISVII